MDDQNVAVFCLVDDMLKAIHHYEDPQVRMTDVKVITTPLCAALFFDGNFEHARKHLEVML